MPLYEYLCPKCGRFELIRKFSDEAVTKCPTCGAEVQKLLSAPAIQFKGTGWYITDYARKDGKSGTGESSKGPSGKSDGAKSEGGKSEGKSEGGSNRKTVLVAGVVAAAVIIAGIIFARAPILGRKGKDGNVSDKSGTSPKSAGRGNLQAGSEASLYVNGLDSIPVAVDEQALSELMMEFPAGRSERVEALVQAGKVFRVDNDTRVRILEVGSAKLKIRALEGGNLTLEGWVPERWVR